MKEECQSFTAMIPIPIIPLLQFHVSVGNNEAPSSADASPAGFLPITSACKFNIRQLDLARFTCRSDDDNMLLQLAKKQEAAYGDIVVVITSFQYDEEVAEEISAPCRMHLSINQDESSTKNIHAIPLTIDILHHAIEVITGEQADAFSTVEDGLKIYFRQLESLFVSDRSALDFIKNHTWTTDLGNHDDVPCDGADSKHVRRFLHKYLARKTRIVAHCVDGIHRVTAFDCALLGLVNTTIELGGVLDFLGNKKINIIAFTPTAITEDFADVMKGKSNEIQRSLTQNLPHTLRDFLHQEMRNLHSNDTRPPYLWDCLGALYRRLAGIGNDYDAQFVDTWIHSCELYDEVIPLIERQFTIGDINGHDFTKIITRYIQSWVKHTAEAILLVLGKSKHQVFERIQDRDIVDDDSRVSDMHMFMRSINRRDEFTIFACRLQETRLIHLLKDPISRRNKIREAITSHSGFLKLFTQNRFGKRSNNDVIFMSCQILLWSRTSQRAYQNLIRVFSSFSQECSFQNGHGNEADAFRWVTFFFHNVTDSAFHSFGAWKYVSFKFEDSKGCVAANNPEEAVYLCLLGSAIATCSDFFWKLGLKPTSTQKFIREFLQQNYTEDEDMDSIDYLSALVISHSIRMDKSEKTSHPSDSYRLYRKRVNHNIDHGNRTKNVLTPRRTSNIASYRIIGDPRNILSVGEYSDFVQVLTANDSDTNQDLFTARISQHEVYLLSGKDNLKDTLGKLVDQEGANYDSDSSQKDKDEDTNEDEDEDKDKDEDNHGSQDDMHEDNEDDQDNYNDKDNVGGGTDNREKGGGGRGNQQGKGRGRGNQQGKGRGHGNQQGKGRGRGNQQGEPPPQKNSKKGKGHLGGSDKVTNLPTDNGEAEEGEVEDRFSEEDTSSEEEDTDANQSNISTESNKLSGPQSRQFAMYLRIITSPLFSQFLDQSNESSQIAKHIVEYETHIHSNDICQVSSCNSKHAKYSRLCEHHQYQFIHRNMIDQFARTNLQQLVASAPDGRSHAQQNALSRTNFPEDAIQREDEDYVHPNSQTIRPRNPFISDVAACFEDYGHRDAHDNGSADDGHDGAQANFQGQNFHQLDGQILHQLLTNNEGDTTLEDLFFNSTLGDDEIVFNNSDDDGGNDGDGAAGCEGDGDGKEHT